MTSADHKFSWASTCPMAIACFLMILLLTASVPMSARLSSLLTRRTLNLIDFDFILQPQVRHVGVFHFAFSMSMLVMFCCLCIDDQYWTCSHSPVWCSCFSFSFNSFSLICHRILTFFQLLLCATLFTLTAARFRLRHSSHSLSLPADNRTSRIGTHPQIHGVHPAVHVQLDDYTVSIVWSVRILFIQHHDIASLHDLSH